MSRVPIRLPSRSKYGAVRTGSYASKREAERGAELELMQREGLIRGLEKQVPFILIHKSEHGAAIRYFADFTYFDVEKQQIVILDVKGCQTPIFRLKKRLMAELGFTITEVK